MANENRTLREQLQEAERIISEMKETAIKATKTKAAPSHSPPEKAPRGTESRPLVAQTVIRLDAQERADHVRRHAELQAEWDRYWRTCIHK